MSVPVRAFSADFDLRGSAQRGSLSLFSPWGTTLAQLQWDQSGALLQTTGPAQHYETLDELTRLAIGTNVPIASLFSWLEGKDVQAPGWEVDLQALPMGRLDAQRLGLEHEAPVELKIVLEP